MEYGSPVWNNCDDNEVEFLEGIQLEAARIVSGAIKGTSHDELYSELGWEPLKQRRDRQQLLLYHKMTNGQAPVYLQELVPPKRETFHSYPTSSSRDLDIIKCNSELYRNSFLPHTSKKWNKLPIDTRSTNCYNTFKLKFCQNVPITNQIFYEGDRRSNILYARLRMGCSNLKFHLYSNIHVVESPKCSCGRAQETVDHYFFFCPLYIRNRSKMLTELRQITNLSLSKLNPSVLLRGNEKFTSDINKAIARIVQQYITETGRFREND